MNIKSDVTSKLKWKLEWCQKQANMYYRCDFTSKKRCILDVMSQASKDVY